MINIPKGTKDVLPQDSYKWQYVEDMAREIAGLFNLKEIRTPTFEHTELFQRGVGDTTDIVTKEMYTFKDKGDRSITLKPEGTAGAVRSFIESGLMNGVLPAKMYYITPAFRYERPQAGRLREFHQFGVEIFGSKSAQTDAEAIVMADTLLKKLVISWGWRRSQGFGCSPIKMARELGSERRETVRSLSVAGVGRLRGPDFSTRGPSWTYLRCICYVAKCIAE